MLLQIWLDFATAPLKLIPPEYRFAALAADYEAMEDMLYGDVPTFETVMSAVSELEKEINAI